MAKLKDYLSELVSVIKVLVCSIRIEQFLVGARTLGGNLFRRTCVCQLLVSEGESCGSRSERSGKPCRSCTYL